MPDAYTRKARIAPAILVAVPGGAVLIAGALSPQTVLRAAGVFLGAVGIVVAVLVRDAGQHVQSGLWERWDGPPAQARLRWRGPNSRAAVARLHQRLTNLTGEQLPDEAAERDDPDDAEQRYNTAIGVLRERTRDQAKFPLVAAENADYGFRRNTYALRWLGLAASVIGLAASVAFLVLGHGELSSRAVRWGPAAGVCIAAGPFSGFSS